MQGLERGCKTILGSNYAYMSAVLLRLKGHEAQVGRKTTLWFLGELKTPFSKEFDKSVKPQKYIVPCTWPATKGCKKCAPSGKQKK